MNDPKPIRVAVIGAGPSGFYTAAALIAQDDVEVRVDIIDQLGAPYGLVRYGVAPDHPRIKSITNLYAKTADDPRVRFFGNVHFGRDITLDDLRPVYDQVVFTVGAQSDRHLNVPGEDLPGSLSATEFVAWYNGHPAYRDLNPNLDISGVAVIGVGNVAMDVSRILARTPDELASTDIAQHALEGLTHNKVTDIHVFGRRGPAQAKFTNPEIKEFGELAAAEPVVLPNELVLDATSQEAAKQSRMVTKNLEYLTEFSQRKPEGKPRRVHFRFLWSVQEILGDGKVEAIRMVRNELTPTDSGYLSARPTDETIEIPVGMVLRSVGYRGVALPGVPFNDRWGGIPNDNGRIFDADTQTTLPGAYVAGWAKRGPSGVIGTNKKDAEETVQRMLEDLRHIRRATGGDIADTLKSKGVRYISFDDWKRIDEAEIKAGEAVGRPRIKFTSVDDMFKVLDDS